MFTIGLNFERSILVDASRNACSSLIADFSQWAKWSPWLILEPGAQTQVFGKPGEIGHKQSWTGSEIGSGEITLTQIAANERLDFDLVFLKPWKSKSRTSFLLESQGQQTKITWTMQGSLPFFLFFLRRLMIGLVGNDYWRGLKMLKDLAENKGQLSRIEFQGIKAKPAFTFVGVERSCLITEIPQFAPNDFARFYELAHKHQLPIRSGKMLCPEFDFASGRCRTLAGAEISGPLPKLPAELITVQIPAHQTLDVLHKGPYRHIGNAWSLAMMKQRLQKHKIAKSIDPYETYLTMPDQGPESEITTLISVPIRS